jgi:hypothetical protein
MVLTGFIFFLLFGGTLKTCRAQVPGAYQAARAFFIKGHSRTGGDRPDSTGSTLIFSNLLKPAGFQKGKCACFARSGAAILFFPALAACWPVWSGNYLYRGWHHPWIRFSGKPLKAAPPVGSRKQVRGGVF